MWLQLQLYVYLDVFSNEGLRWKLGVGTAFKRHFNAIKEKLLIKENVYYPDLGCKIWNEKLYNKDLEFVKALWIRKYVVAEIELDWKFQTRENIWKLRSFTSLGK